MKLHHDKVSNKRLIQKLITLCVMTKERKKHIAIIIQNLLKTMWEIAEVVLPRWPT